RGQYGSRRRSPFPVIRGRDHDYLGGTMLGVRQEVAAELMILFLDVGIQVKVDSNRSPFVLKNAQSTEVDSAPFLTFLALRLGFRFNQRVKCFAHSAFPRC